MSKCTACGDKPENTAKDFTKAVIEINNPETLVLLRKVVIPASMGDDTDVVPAVGKYHNVILQYEANGHIYLYSSDGIPTAIEANIPQEVLDQIAELENDVDSLERADQGLQQEIDELKNSPDVVDIVATYADLQAYDTSTLGDKDVIRVLEDETHNDESAYYRWDKTNSQWVFIGAVEGYYTKDQTDDLLDAKQDLLTPGENITIEDESGALVISATDTKYTAGSNVQISPQNVISATDTTYTHFTGATASADGVQGLVPGPLAGDENKYLKGDGTWGTVQAGPTVVQTTGTSTNDVMSQNATTSMVYAEADTSKIKIGKDYSTYSFGSNSINIGSDARTGGQRGVCIGTSAEGGNYSDSTCIGSNALTGASSAVAVGHYAKAYNGNYATAIGYSAKADNGWRTLAIGSEAHAAAEGSIALGANSSASTQGEMNIGTSITSNGYNNSNYRLIRGVYDGQSAHDAATKGQLDSIAIQNAGAPTTSTVGTVGQLLEDTTNGKLYICTDATNPYVWEEVGAGGGGGPTVVQTTGTSQTDVMSQNAVTSMIFADPATQYKIKIGAGTAANEGTEGIEIGHDAKATQSWAIAIGKDAIASNYDSGALGESSRGSGESAWGIGYSATASGGGAISFGGNTKATQKGSIAIGRGAESTVAGVFSIGADAVGLQTYGYNGGRYRLLTGLYDPQSAHDAATKGYVDNSLLGKQDALTAGSGISITDESGSLVISSTGGGANAFTTNEWNALWA